MKAHDESLVAACLARVTASDARAVRGALNRYMLLAAAIRADPRDRDGHPWVRHRDAVESRLFAYAMTGVWVPPHKDPGGPARRAAGAGIEVGR